MIIHPLTPTVADLNTLFGPMMAEYPSLPDGAGKAVAIEVDALQKQYFLFWAEHVGEKTLPVPNSGELDLSTFNDAFGRPLEPELFLDAFIDDKHLPRMSYDEFFRRGGDGCALRGKELVFRCQISDPQELRILYRLCPGSIGYANNAFTGTLYIPATVLPLAVSKARQVLCALAGEYEAADVHARAFNLCLEKIGQPEKKKARRSAL